MERLVKKADDAGLKPEELDELVHELTASVAADVNNGGLEDQIACLVDGIGAERTGDLTQAVLDQLGEVVPVLELALMRRHARPARIHAER